MVELIIGSVVPIFILVYMVPWSDFYGRKVLIVIALSGKAFEMLVFLSVAAIPKSPTYVLLIG